MPTQTNILDDRRHRICKPDADVFSELYKFIRVRKRLLNTINETPRESDRFRAIEELANCLRTNDDKFGPRAFSKSGAFITVSQFFDNYRPIREPFVIFEQHHDFELRTSYKRNFRYLNDIWICQRNDLSRINAALETRAAFRWFEQKGNLPCYLCGNCVWQMNQDELDLTDEEARLVILEELDKVEQEKARKAGRFEYLRNKFDGTGASQEDGSQGRVRKPIPEKVKMYVWRRDGGKCVQCGSREKLEFDHIIPHSEGGSDTERNLQLLCEQCNRQKSNKI